MSRTPKSRGGRVTMGGKWARTIFFEMGGTSPMGAILSFDNLESIYVEPELKSAGTISISDCRRLLEETIH